MKLGDTEESSAIPLTYATLDADGLPDVIPEVEAAIDRGESLRQVRKRFPKLLRKPIKVERYIAKSFRRRFGLDATDGRCVCCGDATDDVVTVAWSFETGKNFRLAAAVDRPLVLTRHSMCVACFVAWARRTRWPGVMFRFVGFSWIAVIGLMVARAVFRRTGGELVSWLTIAQYSLFAVTILGSVIATFIWRRVVPKSIKRCVPRWMTCSGYESFDSRADLLGTAEVIGDARETGPGPSHG